MSLIETVKLTKQFNGSAAVKEISLSIKEGACTALLGPNGAGKTTTLNMLTGLMKPTSGTVQFHEEYQGDRRKYLGYLPQYPKFYGWMSGKEYLIFAAKLAGLSKEESVKRTVEMLELVGLAEDGKKKVSGYSGGMKQRLGIAQALVHDPKLLILDEPVSALDPIGRREVLELMKKLKKTTSILFSTHVLYDAEEVSDEIFIMKRGEVVVEGGLGELQKTYQQPTIFIETEMPLQDWHESIKNMDWIRHSSLAKNKLTLTVDDLDRARADLWKNKSLQDLKIVKFEVAKTSLEDLFMKVMT
ncbi:ATP-binding cassette domain-containing protein [Salipaludibacillus sp. HK11]|uniref:ABC transporter ATP-binding protein n=1 Tax=Salipaludibacillus sp. HK11 TaxID=3394320 RepID=UPI0039FD9EF7